MLFRWDQILPTAIESLSPLHRDILLYVMNVPGRPTYKYAAETWKLSHQQFDAELEAAYCAIRHHLRRYGISASSDLEFR